jgi:cytochrome c553
MTRQMLAGRTVGLLALAAFLGGAGDAGASMDMQKKAKAAGFPAANCQYCHEDKMPKKEAHKPNPRGQYLVDQKEKRKAKEVDVAWLKEYVEPKK